jgi:hypothetical protein
MPNDAKLGLVIGVAVVVVIAVVFFRKDQAGATPAREPAPAAHVPELPTDPNLPTSVPATPPPAVAAPVDEDVPALPPAPTLPDVPDAGAP